MKRAPKFEILVFKDLKEEGWGAEAVICTKVTRSILAQIDKPRRTRKEAYRDILLKTQQLFQFFEGKIESELLSCQ